MSEIQKCPNLVRGGGGGGNIFQIFPCMEVIDLKSDCSDHITTVSHPASQQTAEKVEFSSYTSKYVSQGRGVE